ncbi:MAG TPA: cytochrome c-type biogenesis protein [Thermoanaerobaculia bacterium]|nr:cytochrome c-type biogenesis protein [Thermoanaerobaculia bacterium]
MRHPFPPKPRAGAAPTAGRTATCLLALAAVAAALLPTTLLPTTLLPTTQSSAAGTGADEGSGTELGVVQDLGAPAGTPLAGEQLDRATHDLASRLRCPVCQGLSVADSTSISALSMRDEIHEMFAKGYSERQIVQYFESAYGEFVLLVPKARGFNLLVWLLPVVGLLVGIALVLRRTRGVVASDEGEAAAAPGMDGELADYRERVRHETAADAGGDSAP